MVLAVKNLPANAGHLRDAGSIPGLGRSPGKDPLEKIPMENPMDRDAWQAIVLRIAESGMNEVT